MQEAIDILKSLLTPTIGIVAVYIAYQQYRTNHLRELRESRKAKLDVYKKIKRFLHTVTYNGTIPKEAYDEFVDAIAEADFLFPESIIEWLDDLHSISAEWVSQEEGILRHMQETGLTRDEFDEKVANTPSWIQEKKYLDSYIEQLHDAYGDLKTKFSKYLELK